MKNAVQIFKALSDETRLRIMGLLLGGELCVCVLVAVLELPQSTISRHLATLRNSGMVIDRREGVWMHYSLAVGEDSFHSGLVEFLRRDIAGLPQVKRDQQALKEYMAGRARDCK